MSELTNLKKRLKRNDAYEHTSEQPSQEHSQTD